MKRGLATTGLLALLLCGPTTARAQTSAADRCETDADARKDQWDKNPHGFLANVWEVETREDALAWCRLWATSGAERIHKAEDFGRVFLTSDGVHPSLGVAAPNSGIGGGAVLELERASATKPLRFDGSAEYRTSISGSWDAGAVLNVLGSDPARGTEVGHAYGSIEATHVVATQRVFFVPQAVGDPLQTRFRLEETTGRGVYHTPEWQNASLFAEVGVSAFRPGPPSSSEYASTQSAVTDGVAPGLTAPTTYGIWGGGLNWHYPQDDVSYGYSTQLAASMRVYDNAGGLYSFRRADVTWAQQFTPSADTNYGTVSTTARLMTSTPAAGSRVPFYLQPTLGGNDIEHEAGLRSYEYDRFRAQDLIAAQMEYTRTIYGPIAWLLFVDVGQSMDGLSSITAAQWHSSRGIGVTLRAGNVAYFRAYLAWGGGFRPGTAGDSNQMLIDSAQRGRGVF